MICVNGEEVKQEHFPDGTLLVKQEVGSGMKCYASNVDISWNFESNEELQTLIFVTMHLRDKGVRNINLNMPYIPNARQDRVVNPCDIFTLKYFCKVINWLNFSTVTVLDPHSTVSEALIDRLICRTPKELIVNTISDIKNKFGDSGLSLFYPDNGACKRYSSTLDLHIPYTYGIKNRDWSTGKIIDLKIAGNTEHIANNNVLIIDDICSKGGTFYYSAKKLKELGANKVFLYVSHCESSVYDGEMIKSGLIDCIYTTDSIFKYRRVDKNDGYAEIKVYRGV